MRYLSRIFVPVVVMVIWWIASSQVPAAQMDEEFLRAIKSQNLAEVIRFTDRGADVNAHDLEGFTPLYWAAAGGNRDLVERLVASGAKVNGRTALGVTPLCVAAHKGRTETVKLLLLHGAKVNAMTDSEWSALLYSTLSGAIEVMAILLDHGAEISPRNSKGVSPIIVASTMGREPVARLLLDRGANPDSRDMTGATPIIAASYRGHVPIVKLLLERRADVNIPDENGWTALMFASMIGHGEVVRLLLDHGADAHITAKDGSTALSLATKRSHRHVMGMLSKTGTGTDPGTALPSSTGQATVAEKTQPGTDPPSTPQDRPSVRDDVVVEHAAKVAQLAGELDRQTNELTGNRTLSRYKIMGTDLGVPFRHKDRTYLLFGDTGGLRGGDAIAYTRDVTPEDGIDLTFVHDENGVYLPVKIPGISQSFFEVPMEGVSVGGNMYIYHTTDHTTGARMGRSVVAVSADDGRTFKYLYDLSTRYFINVSLVTVEPSQWKGLPETEGPGMVMFGSGTYRKSDVRLAFQPAAAIESPETIRYFAGLDASGAPIWSEKEETAVALFRHPCIGEFSVSYNTFIGKWIMLYNCEGDRPGIFVRTGNYPWGPWSEAKMLFDSEKDEAYCRFVHVDWRSRQCDMLHDPGRETQNGDMYGPYQFKELAVGKQDTTTIYFTVSTWNPYTVVLMKATLRKTVPGSAAAD